MIFIIHNGDNDQTEEYDSDEATCTNDVLHEDDYNEVCFMSGWRGCWVTEKESEDA